MTAKPDGRSFNLTGAADPEVPGWEERALAAVKKRQKKSHRWTDRHSGVLVAFDDPFRVLLDEAARRRDISMSGYCRRAAAAFIAYDLGMPLESVLMHSAQPAPYSTGSGGRKVRTNDTGAGFGNWVIGRLFRQTSDT